MLHLSLKQKERGGVNEWRCECEGEGEGLFTGYIIAIRAVFKKSLPAITINIIRGMYLRKLHQG